MGGGTALEDMKRLAVELGIDDYVTFTGRVPDAALLAMLNTADVCVNPDVANDMNDKSTMNKILEYMAFGLPVVLFDLTEGRRSAADAALYARPSDAVDFAEQILTLLNSESLCRELGDRGRKRIEQIFNWETDRKALLEAYRVAAAE